MKAKKRVTVLVLVVVLVFMGKYFRIIEDSLRLSPSFKIKSFNISFTEISLV